MEYEKGELIEDWSTLKVGDIVMYRGNLFEITTGHRTRENKTTEITAWNYFVGFIRVVKGSNTLYRAIPKKKKVMKYLYEYVGNYGDICQYGYSTNTKKYFLDDEDFIKDAIFSTETPKVFHRLDWTATPFDE